MKTILSALLLMFTFHSFSQIEATTNDGKKVVLNKNGTWKYAKTPIQSKEVGGLQKKEALEFSMTVARSLFEGNVNVFIGSMPTEIFTFKEVIVITKEIEEAIKKDFPRAVRDSTKTFANYLVDYKIELLNKEELETKIKTEMKTDFKFPEHYKVIDGDLFFLGFQQKINDPNANYVSDDFFTFMVRKIDGKWQIKGLLAG